LNQGKQSKLLMTHKEKKSFFRRLLNFKILFRYIREALKIIRQGAYFKDKLVLSFYFLRIPGIIIKSLISGKQFRELEEKNKFLRKDIILKNKHGTYYCGNNILTIYTASQDYEKHLHPYLNLNSGVFIDVGAHIGKYSVMLGKKPGIKIISIEPEKNNFSMLEKNIALNNIRSVTTINKGVYSTSGIIPFYVNDKGDGTHSALKQSDNNKPIFIEVDTLDNLINDLNLQDEINLIKIDSEGTEKEILKGATQILEKCHPLLVVEIWKGNEQNLNEIISFLKSYSYSIIQLDEDNYFFS
jgi:FkbM family methyltransferase